MKTIVLLCAAALLAGCATAKKTYTPDGRQGYAVACSGEMLNWGDCYHKAGDICGARGYNIEAKSGDQGGAVSANQYGLYGGSVTTRSMIIACKAQPDTASADGLTP